MTTAVRFTRGRAVYMGRLARGPFAAWLATPEGRALATHLSLNVGFSLFGKTRAAQRRLWRDVSRAAADPGLVSTVQGELDRHLERLGAYAYADGLPRIGVELHRLVVVPRVLINAALFASLSRTLATHPACTAFEQPSVVADFLALTVVNDADCAVANLPPSPARPVPAGAEWMTVGLNRAFVWRGPSLKEAPWPGHHYVFEVTRDPVTRRGRKAMIEGIQRLESSLPSLTQLQRADILRRAHRV